MPSKAQARPPIDCFYVYPTVSQQMTANSNLEITAAETGVATAQASRFSSKCRVYAPMYRQLTLARLFGRATDAADPALAYNDVKAAWNEYLAKYNKGRGVVLIGHSQGTGVLTRLAAEEIDPKPAMRRKLVSALLIGGGVTVARGKDVGGSFKKIAACRKRSQTGCVIAYNTFAQQPPAVTNFGRTLKAGNEVLCVNPASLKRGATGKAQVLIPTSQLAFGGTPLAPNPWVAMNDLYTTKCMSAGGASWMQANDIGRASDKRVRFGAPLGQSWGLHIVDVNIVLGNLLDLVDGQSAAWRKL
jgi:pimeloyl-ACP methyl ester carboxylesterase